MFKRFNKDESGKGAAVASPSLAPASKTNTPPSAAGKTAAAASAPAATAQRKVIKKNCLGKRH